MMAIIKSCCFGAKSLRSGSFASGLYTLASYTLFVTIGAFHVNVVIHIPVLFILSVLLLLFSGLCVMASVVLLVGLCVDNRKMLIPWMLVVSMTTTLDILLCCFFINDKETVFDIGIWILLVSDISMCLLNIYCVLCVYSQYQEYLEGRGGPEGDQRRRNDNEFVILAPNFLYKQRSVENNIFNRIQDSIDKEDYDKDADTRSTSHSNTTSFVTSGLNASNDQNGNSSVNSYGFAYNKKSMTTLSHPNSVLLVEESHHLENQHLENQHLENQHLSSFNVRSIPLTI